YARLEEQIEQRKPSNGPCAGSAPSTKVHLGLAQCARSRSAVAPAVTRACKDNLHCPSRAAFRSIVACTGRRSFEGFAHYVGAEGGQPIEGRARAVLTVRSRPPQRRMERRGPVARVSSRRGLP